MVGFRRYNHLKKYLYKLFSRRCIYAAIQRDNAAESRHRVAGERFFVCLAACRPKRYAARIRVLYDNNRGFGEFRNTLECRIRVEQIVI